PTPWWTACVSRTSAQVHKPPTPGGERGELGRHALADVAERRHRAVDPEVGQARLAEDPVAAIENALDHPKVFVHIMPELLAAHLENVPWPSGACLHLFEHPALLLALEDRRHFRDDVPPNAFLE